MKKRIAVLFLFLALALQCGCGPDYVVLRGHYEPFGILENDMPYADKLNDKQFDHVKKIETDSHGRAYYIYSTHSIMWGHELNIHVISQKSDRKNVYYYEDLCYIMADPGCEPLEAETIDAFKEWNDWDRPLDTDKMSIASKDTSQMEIVDLDDLESAVLNHLGFPADTAAISNGIEICEDNSQIFIIQIDGDGDRFSDPEYCYILLYSLEDGGKILCLEEFPLIADCNKNVIAFREKCMEIINDAE